MITPKITSTAAPAANVRDAASRRRVESPARVGPTPRARARRLRAQRIQLGDQHAGAGLIASRRLWKSDRRDGRPVVVELELAQRAIERALLLFQLEAAVLEGDGR